MSFKFFILFLKSKIFKFLLLQLLLLITIEELFYIIFFILNILF